MSRTSIGHRSKAEHVAQQLLERIIAAKLKPGVSFATEAELLSQFNVSRPTLREAIKALAEAGVLEVRRGQSGGIFVAAELIPRELLESRQEIRFGEIAGVLEARRLLEPRVAQLAAVHASEDDFALMAQTIERQRELAAADDFLSHEDLFLQLDMKFHPGLARATRNSTSGSDAHTARHLESHATGEHAELMPGWTIDIHERTLTAVRAADFALTTGHGRAPRPAGADLGARNRPRAGAQLPDFLQRSPIARAHCVCRVSIAA